MTILAIDPGATCGVVQYEWSYGKGRVIMSNCVSPEDVVGHAGTCLARDVIVIEKLQCYGIVAGESLFSTAFNAGRMYQAFYGRRERVELLPRIKVKTHLCGRSNARDTDVWHAICERFGGDAAVGTKKKPGPLYGVKSHARAALALAVTWAETSGQG